MGRMGSDNQRESQKARKISFEGDALRMSMDWTVEDLASVQVLVESTQGSSHPSSYHLGELVSEMEKGVYQCGGKPAIYTTTDICDGVAQAHNGSFCSQRRGSPEFPYFRYDIFLQGTDQLYLASYDPGTGRYDTDGYTGRCSARLSAGKTSLSAARGRSDD